jgi:hypothetical protein
MTVNRSLIDGCDPLCCPLSDVSINIRHVVVVRQSLSDQAVPDLRRSFRAVYSGVIRRIRTRHDFLGKHCGNNRDRGVGNAHCGCDALEKRFSDEFEVIAVGRGFSGGQESCCPKSPDQRRGYWHSHRRREACEGGRLWSAMVISDRPAWVSRREIERPVKGLHGENGRTSLPFLPRSSAALRKQDIVDAQMNRLAESAGIGVPIPNDDFAIVGAGDRQVTNPSRVLTRQVRTSSVPAIP